MNIRAFETYYWQSNMYLVTEAQHGIIVDPCEMPEAESILTSEGISLDYVILTHEHCDHITGVDWARAHGAKVICSAECGRKIQNPALNAARYFNDATIVQHTLRNSHSIPENFSCHADITFEGTSELIWCNHTLELVGTPGHTSGSICITIDNEILFSGDTVLKDVPVNTRFPSGSRNNFLEITLPWLSNLKTDFTVFPGHWEKFMLKGRMQQNLVEEGDVE